MEAKKKATWLQGSDDNTIFFQNFSKGRKILIIVLELDDPSGGKVSTVDDLTRL